MLGFGLTARFNFDIAELLYHYFHTIFHHHLPPSEIEIAERVVRLSRLCKATVIVTAATPCEGVIGRHGHHAR